MKKVDFGNGKLFQNIMRTAMPLLAAQLLNLLYNIVDRIYIGRIPGTGTLALGAVGLCFPFILIISAFTNMYGMGGSPLFAMELGRGNTRAASIYQNTVFRLHLVTGICLMVLGEIFCTDLLRLFGATQTELPYAVPYLRIYLLGTVFSMISTGMNPFINAQGYPVFGMMSIIIGAAANLLLDPLFIFGFSMGVEGAAIATVISQGMSMLFVLWFLFRPQNYFRIRLAFAFPKAREIIGLGTATFIMNITDSLVSLTCNSILMAFGGTIYVSIMTIISSVRQIITTPILAFAEGTSPIISYTFGASRYAETRKAIRIMTVITFVYTALTWILIEWMPHVFISIFSSEADILEKAVPALHMYFYTFVFQAFQLSGQVTFKSLNRKWFAIFFSLFRKALLVVPLTYLFAYGFGLGVNGVFMAEPVSNLVGGSACFITMLFTAYRNMEKMGIKENQNT